jgi:hypothetical protein
MARLIPTLILLICIGACKKDSDKPSLSGTWKQTEFYDGRPAQGCFCWKAVNEFGAYYYEFKSDGTYISTPPVYSATFICPGTWLIVNDSTLALTNSCGGTPEETIFGFKKEGNILTLEQKNPSSDFKQKFKRVRGF